GCDEGHGAGGGVGEVAVGRAATESRNAVGLGGFLRRDDLEGVGDDAVLVVDLCTCGTGTEDQAENGGTCDGGVTSGLEATRLDSHDYSVCGGGDLLRVGAEQD